MTHPMDDGPPETPGAAAATAQSASYGPGVVGSSYPGRGLQGLDFTISNRVLRGATAGAFERSTQDPLYRPLRIYAIDPSASRDDGAIATVNIPYEPLMPGPTGCLLRVIDDEAE